MRSKAETFRLIISGLLKPLESRQVPLVPDDCPREADALWQIGHAAFDVAQALISPFERSRTIEERFSDRFHGKYNQQPWNGTRPDPREVLAWWNDIVRKVEQALNEHSEDEILPEPVAFTAYKVYSLGEAFDYAIYHTSFHIGMAQARLGVV